MNRSPRRRARTAVALVLSVSLIAAACGDDGGDDDAATTTSSSTTTTTEATTTTTEPGALMPLNGQPVTDEAAAQRVAMVVKIDNHPRARPQRGLTAADVVFEELVEGNQSRFMAVFHSHLPDPVGPIRSARTSDIDLTAMFGRPVFSSSGGNIGTMAAIRDNDVAVVAGHDSAFGGFFFRSRDGDLRRVGPHNLFVNLTELAGAAAEGGSPPPPFAAFRRGDEPLPATAQPSAGASIRLGDVTSRWVWDQGAGGYLRSQLGSPHVDAEGNQVTAANVLLLITPYGTSPFDSESPEAHSVGGGEAWVLTSGMVVHGSWSRESRDQPYTLRDDEGNTIPLTPGQTWVELLRHNEPPSFL